MPVLFSKAPLLEIIAELRWAPTATPSVPTLQTSMATPTLMLSTTKSEEFFMRLGGALYQIGFQQSERLLPPGFPSTLYQAVVRFRSNNPPQKSVMYQAGPGVFSVNGVRPYRSWQEFAPWVDRGIAKLLEARDKTEAAVPISQVSLRYIDFFGEDFLRGQDAETFIDNLGIHVAIPTSIKELALENKPRNSMLRFVIPIAMGNLVINVGDGKVNNQDGVIMETAVSSGEVSADSITVLDVLDRAHMITHEIFIGMTNSIQHLMEPRNES